MVKYWSNARYISKNMQISLIMNRADAVKIEKAAEDACCDAMFEVHRLAREYGTTVVIEVDGVTVETLPLTDAQLRERQAKIK
ncbi:MAG: hypothetical protein CL590_07355 [Alteromonadaceae bacterium]|nr:hypothetical protein [Alteromonadaceae bacterium]